MKRNFLLLFIQLIPTLLYAQDSVNTKYDHVYIVNIGFENDDEVPVIRNDILRIDSIFKSKQIEYAHIFTKYYDTDSHDLGDVENGLRQFKDSLSELNNLVLILIEAHGGMVDSIATVEFEDSDVPIREFTRIILDNYSTKADCFIFINACNIKKYDYRLSATPFLLNYKQSKGRDILKQNQMQKLSNSRDKGYTLQDQTEFYKYRKQGTSGQLIGRPQKKRSYFNPRKNNILSEEDIHELLFGTKPIFKDTFYNNHKKDTGFVRFDTLKSSYDYCPIVAVLNDSIKSRRLIGLLTYSQSYQLGNPSYFIEYISSIVNNLSISNHYCKYLKLIDEKPDSTVSSADVHFHLIRHSKSNLNSRILQKFIDTILQIDKH